ncbi:MAG: YcgN family cysteine cluster protein [Sphingomonadaceae bacterium]
MGGLRPRFWELPLAELGRDEWEALCDGCGKCCLHKVEYEETGEVFPTDIACRLLDIQSCRCGDYAHRRARVPDCVTLTAATVGDYGWLPGSCAYRRRAEGRPLADWHYLICGDRERVHREGRSVRGRAVPEAEAGDPRDHLSGGEL